MKQFIVTPSASKRLIAKAMASHNVVLNALKSRIVVIVASTTNGYIAEEILKTLNMQGFFFQTFLSLHHFTANSSNDLLRATYR
jgi:hypothetical protein